MPELPLHPAIVHLPLGLAFAAPLLAAGIAFAVWRGRLPRAAFAILAALLVTVAASGFAAMQAGERDEDRVERVVAKQYIHEHEERAEVFVWTAAGVAALSVVLLFAPAGVAGGLGAAVIAGTLAVAVLAARTGEAGGEIVYHQGGAAAFGIRAPGQGAVGAAVPASHRDQHGDHD